MLILVRANPDDPVGAILLHLDGVEAGIAADIEHAAAA
jgi:hypothetical protein